jgi:NTP pyrophosphatase (non-canonical NTP hydrolase)
MSSYGHYGPLDSHGYDQSERFTASKELGPHGKSFRIVQYEVIQWRKYNFPKSTAEQQFLGMVEEVGEISHAILKAQQGIRGYTEEDTAEIKDGIGDLLIFLINFCDLNGWDALDILQETWEQVSKRDWQKNPATGVDTDNP